MIKSEHQHTKREDARIDVHLARPIENAVGVRLKSFTIANDLYNVHADNATFTLLTYLKDKNAPHIRTEVTIEPGFYTVDQLKDKVLKKLQDDYGGGDDTTNQAMLNDLCHQIKFDIVDGYLTITISRITAFASALNSADMWRVVLYHPPKHIFKTSVIHRLGFSLLNTTARAKGVGTTAYRRASLARDTQEC